MKRLLSIILTLALVLLLAGCADKPDTVVSDYCNALKSFDFDTAATYMADGAEDFENPFDDEELKDDVLSEQIISHLKENAAKITYKISETKVDGDKATVNVTFSYADVSPIIEAAFSKFITEALGLAFSGADESEIENMFSTIFAEKIESVTPGTATADVVFNCVKADGNWKISDFSEEDGETIGNVLLGNFISAFEGLGGEDVDTDAEEAEE
jgi:uncharacterized lipoprotein YehR (DUF1307 family)